MCGVPDHLAHADLAVGQLGPCRPERENDPIRLGYRVRHFLRLVRGQIKHLDVACCDLFRVIMPHLFPNLHRDDLGVPCHGLGDDILDPYELRAGIFRFV